MMSLVKHIVGPTRCLLIVQFLEFGVTKTYRRWPSTFTPTLVRLSNSDWSRKVALQLYLGFISCSTSLVNFDSLSLHISL